MIVRVDAEQSAFSTGSFSRRSLIAKCVPGLFAGSALICHAADAETPGTPARHFPTEPRDGLAVTSWPFRTYIESPANRGRKPGTPGMDLTEFPAFVVRNFGVRNINPLADHFRSVDPAYIKAFSSAVQKAGSQVVDLGLGGGSFFDADPAARQTAIDYGSKWIEIASQLGSPSVRQHLRTRAGQKPQAGIAADGLARLAEYGARRNVVVNLENDSAVAEDPFLIVSIVEKVNSPYLRSLPDFGNTLIGHDEDYNRRGVEAMLNHAYNMCHVKDAVQGDDGREVKVDLPAMFALARRCSYKGYYSMEFDTDFGDPVAGTRKLVQESLQYLA